MASITVAAPVTASPPAYTPSLLVLPVDSSATMHFLLFTSNPLVVLEISGASASMIHRRLKLGYNRAARLVEQMQKQGIVGPSEGAKPRQVLITRAQWQERQMGSTPESGGEAPWDEE